MTKMTKGTSILSLMNNTSNTNSNITLTEAVKALYTQNTGISVKEILGSIQTQHTHLNVDYRKVYNTLKRVNGSTKTSQMEKASVVLDISTAAKGTAEKHAQQS